MSAESISRQVTSQRNQSKELILQLDDLMTDGWFIEGFDTMDRQEATALLEELRS